MLTIIFFVAAVLMFCGCIYQANLIPGQAPPRFVVGLTLMMVGDMALALMALYKAAKCPAVAWLGDTDLGLFTVILLGISFWLFSERRLPYSHGR